MKIKIYKILGMLLVLSMFTVSCEYWIDTELNEDPNALTDVTMKSLLPQSQLSMFYVIGDADMTGYTGAWVQHLRGADRQFSAVNNYNITPTDLDNLWDGMYENNLEGLQVIKEKAADQSSPHYAGVAKLMEAVSLEILTNYFGALAYSDAFQGEQGNYQPEYDSQQEIYNTISTLISDGITDLEAAQNEIPLDGDMVYNADVDKWIKFAYSLRARVNMHFTLRGEVSYPDVISDIEDGVESLEDDFELPFMDELDRANPMYQFLVGRQGYIADNSFFQNFIEGDPRKDVLFYEPKGDGTTGFWYSPESPVALLEYPEMLYLKAEAYYRNDEEGEAQTTLKEAIDVSLAKYGIEDDAWQDSVETAIDSYTGDDLLEEIMEQKYIHMFGNPTIAYCDFRRTGYPDDMTPTEGSRFPDRFPYPQDEINYNDNTPDHGSIFSTLWIFEE